MKHDPSSHITRKLRPTLIAACALLAVNALRATEFFDGSVFRETNCVAVSEANGADTSNNRVPANDPVPGAMNERNLKFSDLWDAPAAEGAHQAGGGEGRHENTPLLTAIFAVAGLVAVIGYRKCRPLRYAWSGRIGREVAFVAFLVFAGLSAIAETGSRMFSALKTAR